MALQAILEAQELSQKRLAVLGEFDATLGTTDRGNKGNRRFVEQLVPPGIATARLGNRAEKS